VAHRGRRDRKVKSDQLDLRDRKVLPDRLAQIQQYRGRKAKPVHKDQKDHKVQKECGYSSRKPSTMRYLRLILTRFTWSLGDDVAQCSR
jgi:hypothetical protein